MKFIIFTKNVTYQELPGGLITLNECEIASAYDTGLIFTEWADKPINKDKTISSELTLTLRVNYYWLSPGSTETPNINEKFSQMSSFLNHTFDYKPDLMYTIFGNNDSTDLDESELWFIQ